MANYTYKMNPITGKLDMVNSITGLGSTPTSDLTIYKAIVPGANIIEHSGNARFVGADVWSCYTDAIITLVNELRTDYELHRADAAQHTTGVDAVNVITAPAATDFITAYNLAVDIMTQYIAHNADAELGVGWAYHAAQNTTPHTLTFGAIAYTSTALVAALTEIRSKYNAHDHDPTSHGVQDLHQIIAAVAEEAWALSIYGIREDITDLNNNIIIDSMVDDYVKLIIYF